MNYLTWVNTERNLWQDNTKKEILNKLLLKVNRNNLNVIKDDKLVVMYGNPQVGKTTFVLTLIGVKEECLFEIEDILRADIEPGRPSTSTAIIYQKSDDNLFGISDRKISDILNGEIEKYDDVLFKKRLKKIRESVEGNKRNEETVIYIYIPAKYFSDNFKEYDDIVVLDLPGENSSNKKEKKHVNNLLKKYLNYAVLNIVVRRSENIQSLEDFQALNGDNIERMAHKYIVVTTRSYSAGSTQNYFKTETEDREVDFETYLKSTYQEGYKEVFPNTMPQIFEVDLGQSFYKLVNEPFIKKEDKDELIKLQEKTFNKIREVIQEKKGDSFGTWIKELSTEIDSLKNINLNENTQKIKLCKNQCNACKGKIGKLNKNIKSLNHIINKLDDEREELEKKKKASKESLSIDTDVADLDDKEFFEEPFEKFFKKIEEKIHSICEQDDVFYEYLAFEVREFISNKKKLSSDLIQRLKSKRFIFFNKYTLSEKNKKIKENLENFNIEFKIHSMELCEEYYCKKISEIEVKKEKVKILIKEQLKRENKIFKETEQINKTISELEKEKEELKDTIKKDEELLKNFKQIAYNNYFKQRKNVIVQINNEKNAYKKVEYLILLTLLDYDYRRECEK